MGRDQSKARGRQTMKVGDLVTGRINSDNRVGIVVGMCMAIGSEWMFVRWTSGILETIRKSTVKVAT
jgi:hypothetical protein